MKKIIMLSVAVLYAVSTVQGLHAADPELTNYKCGIDVVWGGTKGTEYQEEYWYHDKLVYDMKKKIQVLGWYILLSDLKVFLVHMKIQPASS